MPNRIIKSRARGSSVQLADCLSSLMALELMMPSPEIYLISPWISDMPLLRNRFGQFRAVLADLQRSDVGLAAIITLLAERGTRVRVLSKPSQPQTEDFLRKLPAMVERRTADSLHEKGLITHHFYLRGSMNFTYSGANLNDETVELTTEPTEVALALAEARQQWESVSVWR